MKRCLLALALLAGFFAASPIAAHADTTYDVTLYSLFYSTTYSGGSFTVNPTTDVVDSVDLFNYFTDPAGALFDVVGGTPEFDYVNIVFYGPSVLMTGGYYQVGIYPFSVSDEGYYTVTPVAPEPSSLILLATGVTGIAGFARRRFFTA